MISSLKKYVFLILSFALALSCTTVTGITSPTPTPLAKGEVELVSYISDKNGSKEIYVLSLDNHYSLQLTDNDLEEKSIHWSPNGQKVLFTACNGSVCNIYMIDANGENFKTLTNAEKDNSSYTEPAWSPDSMQIAFVGTVNGGKQIYIMDSNGKHRHLLTKSGTHNVSPAWAPNGSKIAFSSNAFGDYDILTVDVDGTNLTKVTNNDYDDTYPVWSPDSTKIAYLSLPDVSKGNVLYLANADGTNPQDISSGIFDISDDVAWSSDGHSIAFSAFPDRKHHQIYGVWSDQWGGTQYSVNDLNNFMPSWAPDGKRLVYYALSKDYDSSEVYINAGGTRNSHQLTFDGANVTYVAWVPIKPSKPNYEFPTFTPEATQDLTDVNFFDDFSNEDNGWSTLSSENATSRYFQEMFQIKLLNGQWAAWSKQTRRYTDVHIEVDTKFDSKAEGAAGIICRYQDSQNFYILKVGYANNKGYYRVGVQENDKYRYLSGDKWVRTDTINPVSNHIAASCDGNQLTLWANGSKLFEGRDNTFSEGKVGLYASAFDAHPVTISFDNFSATPNP